MLLGTVTSRHIRQEHRTEENYIVDSNTKAVVLPNYFVSPFCRTSYLVDADINQKTRPDKTTSSSEIVPQFRNIRESESSPSIEDHARRRFYNSMHIDMDICNGLALVKASKSVNGSHHKILE